MMAPDNLILTSSATNHLETILHVGGWGGGEKGRGAGAVAQLTLRDVPTGRRNSETCDGKSFRRPACDGGW